MVPKKNSTGSIIWQWFGFCKEDEQNTVICKICHKAVATKGSSTTNLFHHLKCHPLQNKECLKLCMSTSLPTPHKKSKEPAPKQMTLASSFANSVPYDKKVQNGKRSRLQRQNTSPKTWPRVVLWKRQDSVISLRHLTQSMICLVAFFFKHKSTTRVVHVSKRKGGPPAHKYDPLLHNYRDCWCS